MSHGDERGPVCVGMEGACCPSGLTQALAYAKERIQGTGTGVRGGPKVSIIHHPDIRRMLMSMKSQTEAMRAHVGSRKRFRPSPSGRRSPQAVLRHLSI